MSLYDFIKNTRGGGGGKGGGQKADFWKPKTAGRHTLRLYRFEVDGTKHPFHQTSIHRTGEKFPIPCSGESCEVCLTYEKLRADPLTREKGWEFRKQNQYAFIAVPTADPSKFILWESTESAWKKVMEAVAKEGGWTGGWPGDTEFEEFTEMAEKGLDKVCGPRGHDLVIVTEPKFNGQMVVSADFVRVQGRVLPFEENDQVPNPKEIRERISASRAKKEAGGA